MNRVVRPIAAVAAACIAITTAARGDIAPSEFVARGIEPAGAAEIRMKDADVEIVWGTPCQMIAVFEFENESSAPIELEMTFPILSYEDRVGLLRVQTAFSVEFAGAVLAANGPIKTKIADDSVSCLEYRFRFRFSPGRTQAKVKAELPASLTYGWGGRQRLFYCLQSGGGWKGTIGREEVRIRFPYNVDPEQIFKGEPKGFTLDGDVVRWVFSDIKPKGSEYDVHLEYLRPDMFHVLSEIRQQHAANPSDTALAIRLAKDLFALGQAKGKAGYLPSRLDETECQAIASRIGDPADRVFFQHRYERRADGVYYDTSGESDTQAGRMARILNAADYQSDFSRSRHVTEARALLEELLKREPRNAEAWNVYLANYNRFSFGGVGIFTCGPWHYYPRQVDLIKRAHELCPDDPIIDLWFKRCRAGKVIDPWTDPIVELAKKGGVFHTDYPKIEYDYY
jgi:hypothetical protein